MRSLLRLLPWVVIFFSRAQAAEEVIQQVRAADDERIAALIAADPARIDAVDSPQLKYMHSGGDVDTEKSLIDSLQTGHAKYYAVRYDERTFTQISPEIVLMNGRGDFYVLANRKPTHVYLTFLAVWRNEGGGWRFLAWQSCQIPEPKVRKR